MCEELKSFVIICFVQTLFFRDAKYRDTLKYVVFIKNEGEDYMIKVLFICYGNICRSPISEFVLKDMVEKQGISDKFDIASAATSTEEIWGVRGNPV